MAEIRVIFGDDRENEKFLGFDLDNIEEAEERYIRQFPKNEGNRVHVPPDEKTCGHTGMYLFV
jgi:hypothetical protein